MAAEHWSKKMHTLWWRDAGTGRARVSFHADRAKLVDKYHKLWHRDIDAALYGADGNRVPLPGAETPKAKRQRKAKEKQRVEAATAPATA